MPKGAKHLYQIRRCPGKHDIVPKGTVIGTQSENEEEEEKKQLFVISSAFELIV